jgi:early secretory antigenic target protein ESAT-6
MVQKMVVTFAALQDAERHIRQCADDIGGKLDDLKTYLAPLTESWSGEASQAYAARMREWNTAAEDLDATLRKIAGIVRTAEANYRNAVTTNKNMWPVR